MERERERERVGGGGGGVKYSCVFVCLEGGIGC